MRTLFYAVMAFAGGAISWFWWRRQKQLTGPTRTKKKPVNWTFDTVDVDEADGTSARQAFAALAKKHADVVKTWTALGGQGLPAGAVVVSTKSKSEADGTVFELTLDGIPVASYSAVAKALTLYASS